MKIIKFFPCIKEVTSKGKAPCEDQENPTCPWFEDGLGCSYSRQAREGRDV